MKYNKRDCFHDNLIYHCNFNLIIKYENEDYNIEVGIENYDRRIIFNDVGYYVSNKNPKEKIVKNIENEEIKIRIENLFEF